MEKDESPTFRKGGIPGRVGIKVEIGGYCLAAQGGRSSRPHTKTFFWYI